jgi:hypothetical protein
MDQEYLDKNNTCRNIMMQNCLEEKVIKLNDYLHELSILDVDNDNDGNDNADSDSDTVKTVTLPPLISPTKKRRAKNREELPPKKRDRVVTKTKQWLSQIDENELSIAKQWQWLQEWKDFLDGSELGSLKNDPALPREMPKCKLGIRQISIKLDGYKKQDVDKKKWDSSEFVNLVYVIDLLIKSRLACFYCKENVKILYKEVRDPKQWTLDRIDNSIGHDCGNVEIACLSCNVRRRTMYHEKYRFTKQLNIEKV